MPRKTQKLVDYFDEPPARGVDFSWCDSMSGSAGASVGYMGGSHGDTVPVGAFLGKWMKHNGDTVYVPDGQAPEDKPEGMHFYKRKKGVKVDDTIWGHDTDKLSKIRAHQAKVAQFKEWEAENKRVIQEAGASGPGQDTTRHIPGRRWRTSDVGYDPTVEAARKQRHSRIEELKSMLKKVEGETLSILMNHGADFKGPDDHKMIDRLESIEGEVRDMKREMASRFAKENLVVSSTDSASEKKSKREGRNKLIHSHVTELLHPEVMQSLISNVAIFAESVGDHVFVGKHIPGKKIKKGKKYIVYSSVLRAMFSTVKHQIMQSLAKEHENSSGKPGEFAAKSNQIREAVRELHSLTHKEHAKPRKHKKGPAYPDHAELVKWHNEHRADA